MEKIDIHGDARDVTGQIIGGLLLNAYYSAMHLHVAQGLTLDEKARSEIFLRVTNVWKEMCQVMKPFQSAPPEK